MINWINIGVKIFGVAFIVTGFVFKASGLTPDITIQDLVLAAAGMVGIFFPVDLSKTARAIRGDK